MPPASTVVTVDVKPTLPEVIVEVASAGALTTTIDVGAPFVSVVGMVDV